MCVCVCVHQIAGKGDLDELERLYKGDQTRVNLKDKKGWTACHHAAAHDQPAALIFLINHGAGRLNFGRPSHPSIHPFLYLIA